jgi:hypothetical protein
MLSHSIQSLSFESPQTARNAPGQSEAACMGLGNGLQGVRVSSEHILHWTYMDVCAIRWNSKFCGEHGSYGTFSMVGLQLSQIHI